MQIYLKFFALLFVCPQLLLAADVSVLPKENTMTTLESTLKNEAPKPVLLADYTPPDYLIKEVHLCFDLEDEKTLVTSKMDFIRNPKNTSNSSLVLNGEELKLLSIKLDGRLLSEAEYDVDEKTLAIHNLPQAFTLEIENEINPKKNTALEGLYKSGGIFCTQNEPEGFRRITYFLDRSDVMAKYTTKIMADQKQYPILLSNGNEIGRGTLDNGRHWVEWQDPFAKPSYLFALVAGDLGLVSDTFTTMSGRKIDLRIYCDKGNEDKCAHAMQSLIKAMRWDEDVFGLEYDLDIYMIVAVDAFNMGAMENKGLNIFNTSCVLGDPSTATDANYARIETVIAHEYFHNWTGNRVTCRDWFQLTLKEGLTVFRDQEFSSDMQSRAVKRIEDVMTLRGRQFAEDAGPTAHPIKPKSYLEVNNFYTATVYNKGAEVIRMIQTLIGKEAFCRGITKYFELYDGQAVTTEDFIYAMEQVSGRDFTQFKRWYSQAGTPILKIDSQYDADKKTLSLCLKQRCEPTADNSEKEPFHFPLVLGFLGKDGQDLPLQITGKRLSQSLIEITQSEETFVFENVEEPPVLSINRNFAAPIKIEMDVSKKDLLFLMAHDSDPFNRWEAGQKLAKEMMLGMVKDLSQGNDLIVDSGFIEAFGAVLDDVALDNELKAKAMILPSEEALAQEQDMIDIDGNHLVREFVRMTLAEVYQDKFNELYHKLNTIEPYHYDAVSVGKRSLKNVCLSYLAVLGTPEYIALCENQFVNAQSMSEQFPSLALLTDIECPQREKALKAFYEQWKRDTLVMNKWLAIQALSSLDGTYEAVHALMRDPVFDMNIPNLVRALIGSFAGNPIHFHRNDGVGYAFIADRILEIDPRNPQLAAGLAQAFGKLSRLDPMRKKAMKRELQRILAQPRLSGNVYEIVSKSLAWDVENAARHPNE